MALVNIGDVRRVSVSFTDAANAAADPTTVTLYVRKPSTSVATSYLFGSSIIVKDATGAYHADLVLDIAGMWAYEWAGTGAVAAAEESTFYVNPQVARG